MDIASDDDPSIRITRILIDNSATHISMRYENTNSEEVSVWVEAPDSVGAFYITDSVGRRYELINVDGIAVGPSANILAPGDMVNFTLAFERLNDTVTEFNVIEAGLGDPNMNYWRFSGIFFK